jgi:hypothetical protein
MRPPLAGVGKVLVLVPAVLARDRPAMGERRRQRPGNTDGRRHCALGPAAALEHEAPVPIGGRRQAHLEAVAVWVSVNTDALVDDALHLAMIGKSGAIRRGAAPR